MPSSDLQELFAKYGTDKGGYTDVYRHFLGLNRKAFSAVLEVGIGTLIPEAHSSMVGYGAPHYRPGGSLRAWADYLPNATIWGLDTQPDSQFTDHDRINTRLADSTDRTQVDAALGDMHFDLIIDDGDHDPHSQIETFNNLWWRLRPRGLYVIEDIGYQEALQIVLDGVGKRLVFLGPHRNIVVVPMIRDAAAGHTT